MIDVDARLLALAEHLEPDLGMRLAALVQVDTAPAKVLELAGQLHAAEATVEELRRELGRVRRELEQTRDALSGRREFAASRPQIHDGTHYDPGPGPIG